MHIVFLGMFPHKTVNSGGIGTFIHTLGKELVINGYKVTVISATVLKDELTETIDGIEVIRVCSHKISFLSGVYNSWRMRQLVVRLHKQTPIDVLEGPESSLAFLKIPKGVASVIRLHGGHHFFIKLLKLPLNKKSAFFEKKSFKKADYFVGVTNYVMNLTSKYLVIPDSKKSVIYLPVNCNKFYEANPSLQVPFKIVFAGTVTEKKGIRQLVMAMPSIIKLFPKTTLHIYGGDWAMADGSSFTMHLKSIIAKDSVDSIIFHGQVPNEHLTSIYKSAHLCAFPSHMETQGLVVLEAMSMGKAVLFSTTGPGPETIEHTKDGLLADPYDPEDIAEKIIHLFSNPGLEINFGKNARKKMLDKYDLPIITKLNMAFYENIVAKV